MIRNRECGGVVSIAQVLELVGGGRERAFRRRVAGFEGLDPEFEVGHLAFEVSHFAYAREQTAGTFAFAADATGDHAIRCQHVAGPRHEGRGNATGTVDLDHFTQIVDQIDPGEQCPCEVVEALARTNLLEQGATERNEALAAGLDVRRRDEDAATRSRLAQGVERRQSARRAVDDDRLGAIREHRLDRRLDVAVDLEQISHQSANPEATATVVVE